MSSNGLPPGWALAPLDALLEEGGLFDGPFGSSLKTDDYSDDGVRVVRLENIANLRFIEDKRTYISHEKHKTLERHTVRGGDVIFGSFIDGETRVCVLPPLDTPAIAKADCFTIRPRHGVLDAKFLAFQLGSRAAMHALTEQIHGVTRPRINTQTLRSFRVALPPFSEQLRVVKALEGGRQRSQRARDALNAVSPLLDKLRQSILAAAFRGDLTADWRAKNPDVDPAREPQPWHPRGGRLEAAQTTAEDDSVTSDALPSSWRACRLGQIVDMSFGFAFASSQFTHTGARLLRGINVGLGQTKWDDTVFAEGATCNPEHELMEGDIVIAMDRPFIADGFRVARLTKDDCPAYLVQRVARLRTAAGVDQQYAFQFLQSERYQRHLRARVTGSSVPHVSGIDIGSAWMALPPLAEQQEIARRLAVTLSPLTKLLSLTEVQLKKLAYFDTALLASAFRGELVPQDPNDEPAAVLLDRIRNAHGDANATPTPHSARTSPRAAGGGIVAPPAPTPPRTEPQPGLDADSLVEHAVTALWPHGPLDKDAAIRRLADHLRADGLVSFQRLRADGPLYAQLADAIDAAVKAGHLDRPKRGQVRACKPDATAYTADDWRHALVAVLGPSPTDRDEAIRAAAEWARDNCGLEFTRLRADGHIITGLRSALNSAIRAKLITRIDATHIARAPAPPADRQLSLLNGDS